MAKLNILINYYFYLHTNPFTISTKCISSVLYIISIDTVWKHLLTVLLVPTIRMYLTTNGFIHKRCVDRQ